VPILHGISREHYAMHAAQLLIDRSGQGGMKVVWGPSVKPRRGLFLYIWNCR